jgi:hypothetical protein
VVKGQATNEVLGQTGRALYTRVTNVLTTWPLSGQQINSLSFFHTIIKFREPILSMKAGLHPIMLGEFSAPIAFELVAKSPLAADP